MIESVFPGISPVINGTGPSTRLGGVGLSPGVWEAMQRSHKENYRMEQLHQAASEEISKLLDCPAALVTAGASAALTLAAATCIAGYSAQELIALPFPQTNKREILIQRTHIDPYDHAVAAAGAKIRSIGETSGCTYSEMKEAVTDEVCAILWRETSNPNELSLKQCSTIAHEKGVQIIVDGALYIPPISRIRSYLNDGADFIAISGGKGFRGPHTSGLLVSSLINFRIALLHHLDLDEKESTWNYAISESNFAKLPSNGIGRSMKVGREQIFGLVKAIYEYIQNPTYETGNEELEKCRATLLKIPSLKFHEKYNIPLNVVILYLKPPSHLSVDEFYLELANTEPRVILGQEISHKNFLSINPMGLKKDEGQIIANKVRKIFESVRA